MSADKMDLDREFRKIRDRARLAGRRFDELQAARYGLTLPPPPSAAEGFGRMIRELSDSITEFFRAFERGYNSVPSVLQLRHPGGDK